MTFDKESIEELDPIDYEPLDRYTFDGMLMHPNYYNSEPFYQHHSVDSLRFFQERDLGKFLEQFETKLDSDRKSNHYIDYLKVANAHFNTCMLNTEIIDFSLFYDTVFELLTINNLDFNHTKFKDCYFYTIAFECCDFYEVEFDSQFTQSIFTSCTFKNCTFKRSTLDVNFKDCTFIDVKFKDFGNPIHLLDQDYGRVEVLQLQNSQQLISKLYSFCNEFYNINSDDPEEIKRACEKLHIRLPYFKSVKLYKGQSFFDLVQCIKSTLKVSLFE